MTTSDQQSSLPSWLSPSAGILALIITLLGILLAQNWQLSNRLEARIDMATAGLIQQMQADAARADQMSQQMQADISRLVQAISTNDAQRQQDTRLLESRLDATDQLVLTLASHQTPSLPPPA